MTCSLCNAIAKFSHFFYYSNYLFKIILRCINFLKLFQFSLHNIVVSSEINNNQFTIILVCVTYNNFVFLTNFCNFLKLLFNAALRLFLFLLKLSITFSFRLLSFDVIIVIIFVIVISKKIGVKT